ncbi:hypothetical protein OROHE_013559 [Orobanche hederae]
MHLSLQKAKLPESGAKRANSAPEEEKIKFPNYADGAGEKRNPPLLSPPSRVEESRAHPQRAHPIH